MGPISDAVDRALDSRDNTENTVFQKIKMRHRLDKDLTELITTIDNQSWAACQHGGGIDPIKDLASSLTITLFDNFEQSDLNSTKEQID